MASAILIEMDDTNTVKCPLCRVDVPIDKIDLPNRCLHPQCPLKRPGARSLQSLSKGAATFLAVLDFHTPCSSTGGVEFKSDQ